MEQQMRSRIIDMTRQNQDIFANEAGVLSSLNENKAKEYLHEVLKEVQKGSSERKGAKWRQIAAVGVAGKNTSK
jgi:hypothetical protein